MNIVVIQAPAWCVGNFKIGTGTDLPTNNLWEFDYDASLSSPVALFTDWKSIFVDSTDTTEPRLLQSDKVCSNPTTMLYGDSQFGLNSNPAWDKTPNDCNT